MQPRISLPFLVARAQCCSCPAWCPTGPPGPSLPSCSPEGWSPSLCWCWGCSFPCRDLHFPHWTAWGSHHLTSPAVEVPLDGSMTSGVSATPPSFGLSENLLKVHSVSVTRSLMKILQHWAHYPHLSTGLVLWITAFWDPISRYLCAALWLKTKQVCTGYWMNYWMNSTISCLQSLKVINIYIVTACDFVSLVFLSMLSFIWWKKVVLWKHANSENKHRKFVKTGAIYIIKDCEFIFFFLFFLPECSEPRANLFSFLLVHVIIPIWICWNHG